jgi:hypothetical protein
MRRASREVPASRSSSITRERLGRRDLPTIQVAPPRFPRRLLSRRLSTPHRRPRRALGRTPMIGPAHTGAQRVVRHRRLDETRAAQSPTIRKSTYLTERRRGAIVIASRCAPPAPLAPPKGNVYGPLRALPHDDRLHKPKACRRRRELSRRLLGSEGPPGRRAEKEDGILTTYTTSWIGYERGK